MKIIRLLLVLCGAVIATAGRPAPVMVKWSGADGPTMQVGGIDGHNRLRLRPMDGSAGEALLPLTEARDLQFVLPDEYREARRRATAGRPAEAVFLLRQVMPAFVPFADIPGSNAGPAVRFYFDLLIERQEWAEALATANGLIETMGAESSFVPDVVRLVRALQAEGRIADAAWLVGRLPVQGADGFNRQLVESVADAMRRRGHWAEAQSIYERLRRNFPAASGARWELLIAYTEWHQGHPLRSAALVQRSDNGPLNPLQHDGLVGLLRGRVNVAQGEFRRALDVLGQTLVGVPTASEWRVELMAVIAEAYRADGHPELARLIEQDLRRMHPDSRWRKPESET